MAKRPLRSSAGQAAELWPVLLLFVTVVVPTIAVLWFLSIAMRNEQLAAKQRLTDAYRLQLGQVQQALDGYWRTLARRVEYRGANTATPRHFADVVATGLVDAIVCYDDAAQLLYPTLPASNIEADGQQQEWREAEQAEYVLNNPVAARHIYQAIAGRALEPMEKAKALQGEARCLFKAGEESAAAELVRTGFTDGELACARDSSQRLVVANVELMAIEFAVHSSGSTDGLNEQTTRILRRLIQRLLDYDADTLPASQRLFVMKRLVELVPEEANFPTLPAENLAAEFVAVHPIPARDFVLQRTRLPDVWQFVTPRHWIVMLLRTETVIRNFQSSMTAAALPESVRIELLLPNQKSPHEELLGVPAAASLPGWRLSLSPRDSREFDTLVAQQKVLHVCIAGIVVVSTSILALVISRAFRRQLRLAGLKNDLVSTVSHELKTPLASMRLLVDTLLDTEHLNGEQTREYLQLIAKENERLSRLIENFLTFSRLERGKHAFVFAAVSVQQLVARSIEAAGERFQRLDCALTSDIAPDLPLVRGDADALVRVLLNLLDNAYKYSRGDRQICVRARADGDRVRLSVSDHGVGMSRAAARRVLQKFFQVDQSLVREGHGCGLGLSIVEYIVRAHGGTITVESRADEGSTFTVTLPTVSAAERNHRDS